ncbi:MAG TPA: hypothetical protein PK733_07865 [Clostridiales bacterium]|nr:hypothetical protein [Clostridiales bacterium]
MNIKVLLWLDVEDYINLQSDDALLLLLDTLKSKGVKAILKIVGEKARVLKERGRYDILEKIKEHEIGYHTNMHSVHPTIAEYLEPLGFREGAYEFERNEGNGFKDVASIISKNPEVYGQPGRDWAPQVFPVLRKWLVHSYICTVRRINIARKPCWYGGLLSMCYLNGQTRMELVEGGLEEGKRTFDETCKRLSDQNTGFVSIFYHPCEFATTNFWDAYNFSNGENTPRNEWKGAPLRSKEEMIHYVDMFGQYIDYILSKDNVEFITLSEALALEKSNNTGICAEDVKIIAEEIGTEVYFYSNNNINLSASEIFSLFCNYINDEPFNPELIYGPENYFTTNITEKVKVSDIKQAVKVKYPRIYDYKQLPDYFTINGKYINPIDMTCTLAKIIKDGLTDNDSVEVVRGCLKSRIHVEEKDDLTNWIVFRKNFQVPNIRKMAGLQAWTLKPALF